MTNTRWCLDRHIIMAFLTFAALPVPQVAAAQMTQIIDSTGDGTHGLGFPYGIAVGRSGNVYVPGGVSSNAFRIAGAPTPTYTSTTAPTDTPINTRTRPPTSTPPGTRTATPTPAAVPAAGRLPACG